MKILCYGLIVFLFSSCKFWDSISGVIKYPIKSIGVVDYANMVDFKHGGTTFYKFNVNGKEYGGSRIYTIGCEENGAAYEIVYDSIYPNFSEINLCKPLFLKEDIVDTTVGRIYYYDKEVIEYSYMYKDEKIKKLQFVCPDTLAKYKDIIKVGNTFLVKYNVTYPKVAILYFDKLIKVSTEEPKKHSHRNN